MSMNILKAKKKKLLTVFDDMIADMESNKKLSPIVTELFLRGRNSTFYLFFFFTKLTKTI